MLRLIEPRSGTRTIRACEEPRRPFRFLATMHHILWLESAADRLPKTVSGTLLRADATAGRRVALPGTGGGNGPSRRLTVCRKHGIPR